MDIWALARQTIADGLPGMAAADVRIPARHAACSVYAPDSGNVPPAAFPGILGVTAVREVARSNGWLLFTLTDEFYDACVRQSIASLPLPPDDLGSHALNRMRALARQQGIGCPREASVQRALWMQLGAAYGYASTAEAARAWARMLYHMPVEKRMEARRACGAMANACARLYGRALTAQ